MPEPIVLLVDNNETESQSLYEVLEPLSYPIVKATDTSQALERLDQAQVGVILCGQTAASSAQKRADTEFLRTLALDHPWVTRILLSEDGDTLSNLNAVNDAHVFKILFKP